MQLHKLLPPTNILVLLAGGCAAWFLYKKLLAPPPAAPAAPVHGLGANGPAGFVPVRAPVRGRLRLVSYRPLNGRGAAGGVSGYGDGLGRSLWDDITNITRASLIAPLALVDPKLRPKLAKDLQALPGGSRLPLLPGVHATPVSAPPAAVDDPTTDGSGWDGIPGDPGDPNLAAEQAAAAASVPGLPGAPGASGAPGSGYRAAPKSGGFNPLVAGAAAVVAIPVLFLVGKK